MALTPTQFADIRLNITKIFESHASISPAVTSGILPIKDLQGKIYEVHVLAKVIKNLVDREGCEIKLINSGTFTLKQKGSPINRSYPYFEIWRYGKFIGELFTDTEFTSQSFLLRSGTIADNSDYHELDIAMFEPGQNGRPQNDRVMLAIECKATVFEKSTFRELLGFRRELSRLVLHPVNTNFFSWPCATILADPGSVHMCYSWDPFVTRYRDNAAAYGIIMVHETM